MTFKYFLFIVAMLITGCSNFPQRPIVSVPDGSQRVQKTQTPINTESDSFKLDSTKSLKENLNTWSKANGWGDVEFMAEDFRVKKTTFIDGHWPDVLQQIVHKTKLNICVTKKPRNIRVTDSRSCQSDLPATSANESVDSSFVVIDKEPLVFEKLNPLEKTIASKGGTSTDASRVDSFKVDSTKSLKENLNTWSKANGWGEVEYQADDLKIKKTTFIDGHWPEVLREIAKKTEINICVTQNPRNIRVTNREINCWDN
jgi:hypothetical protein